MWSLSVGIIITGYKTPNKFRLLQCYTNKVLTEYLFLHIRIYTYIYTHAYTYFIFNIYI